ncbi:4-hydroxythreonine-4-phosphate dehydrogenase PdxA [Persephonella sp.]
MKYAITLGDPSGISPEILVKSADKLPEKTYIIYGSIQPVEQAEKITGKKIQLKQIKNPEEAEEPGFYIIEVVRGNFSPGKPDINTGRAAVKYLERAVDHIIEKKVDALITLPISKEHVMSAGFSFPGHTDYLAYRSGTERYIMMLACEEMKVALLTTHIPLKNVPEAVSRADIAGFIRLLHRELKDKFRIKNPLIGILGLNPHGGDGGKIGTEEIEVIQPAVDKLKKEGLRLEGCLPPDTAFVNYRKYDAYLAMYHDQGLIPLKMLCFKKAVNITLGLPFIRTSPDHGTGFDIAGKNMADPSSFISAVKMAVKLAEETKPD